VIEYIPIGLQLALALILAGVILTLATVLGRPKRSHTDLSPYECGVDPLDASDKRVTIRFYMVAMLFILFDIEAAFLIPWAVTFKSFSAQKGFVLGEMAVFLVILVAGYVYLWCRGALEWD
jgi:NADH:ubiquinone oxidoreductase subunit 3 (subunit A)